MPLGDVRDSAASDDAASELAALREEVAQLRQAVQARDDFIAIAGHELRNPMTPIQGCVELALTAAHNAQGTCPPRITVLLDRMHVLVHDFIKRSTSLLDVSRIETGNLQLERATTDLSAIVRSVAQNYEATAVRVRSPLLLDIENGVAGFADKLAVEQVVENLLSNALKFGAGKPVAVLFRSDGQSARLDIQDQGIGMTSGEQARIFARFEQVMTQHKGSGFGIGLWVANRLVLAMDGEITVTSSVGNGSTFTMMLPLPRPSSKGTTI